MKNSGRSIEKSQQALPPAKKPPNLGPSMGAAHFRAEIREIFLKFDATQEPWISNIRTLLRLYECLPLDDFIRKWEEFVDTTRKTPFFGLRANVLLLFIHFRRLRLMCHRIFAVLAYMNHPKTMRWFHDKLVELLFSVSSASMLDNNCIAVTMFSIQDLVDIHVDKQFDCEQYNGFNAAKISDIISILKQVHDVLRIFRDSISFFQAVNEITNKFNSHKKKNIPLLPVALSLNICSCGCASYSREAIKQLSEEETLFFSSLVESLTSNQISTLPENEGPFRMDELYPPDLSPIFSPLARAVNNAKEKFSEKFIRIVDIVVQEPTTESLVFDALSEASRIKSEFDQLNQTNEYVDEICRCLKIIHSVYILLNALDFCCIVQFQDSIALTYIRTFCHILTTKDCFKVLMLQPIPQKIITDTKKIIRSLDTISSLVNIQSLQMKVRKYFNSLLDFVMANYSEKFMPLLSFLFSAHTNGNFYEDSVDIARLLSLLPNRTQEADEVLQYLAEFNKQMQLQSTSKKSQAYVMNFFKKFSDSEDELQSIKFPFDIIPLLKDAVKKCIDNKTIRINGGFDESIFEINEIPRFFNKLIQFHDNMEICVQELYSYANRLSNTAIAEGNQSALDAIYCIDLISRGYLSTDILIRFLNVALVSKHAELTKTALSYINLWRFFILRDEVGWSASVNVNWPSSRIAYSSIRHFNMKSFLTTFSSSLLYLNIVCGSPIGYNSLINGISDCIEMKRLSNEIPYNSEVSPSIVSAVDSCFRRLCYLLNNLDVRVIASKAKSLLQLPDKSFSAEAEAVAALIRKTVLQESYNVSLYTETVVSSQKFFLHLGIKGTPLFEQFISYVNTLSMYQHMKDDVQAFSCFLLSSASYVTLIDPLLIIAHMPDNFERPIIPLQIGLAPSNPDFSVFCYTLQKNEVAKLTDITDLLNSEIAPPSSLLPLNDQNLIAQMLQSELEQVKQHKESDFPHSDGSSECNEAYQKLIEMKKKVDDAEAKQRKLQAILSNEIASGKESLHCIKHRFSTALYEFNTNNSTSSLEIDKLNSMFVPLNIRIERKRKMAKILNDQLNLFKEVSSTYLAEEKFSKQSPIYEKPSNMVISLSSTAFVPFNRSESHKEDVDLSQPSLPIPIIKDIPLSITDDRSKDESESNEMEIEMRQTMIPTPESLRSIIGDEWAEETKQSVQNSIERFSDAGYPDPRAFLELLKR